MKTAVPLKARFATAHRYLVEHRYPEARQAINRLLRSLRDHPQVRLLSASCDIARGEPALALPTLIQLIAEYPDAPMPWEHLANAYKRMEDFEAAAHAYRRVLAYAPERITPLVQLAGVRGAMGDVPEALSLFLQAATMPCASGTGEQFNRGLARLILGMGEGFADYEAREAAEVVRCEDSQAPVWDGQPTEGTVLLLQEQGFGDTLQMLRFVPHVLERAGHVLLCVPPALAPLCQAVFRATARLTVLVQRAVDFEGQDAHHYRLLPMSLPHVVGREAGVDGAPYLQVHGLDLLPPAMQSRRVALAWKGNPNQADDRTRSIPLAELVPLFGVPGIEWVSVQMGATEDERALLLAHGVRDASPLLTDFHRTALVLNACDHVVSVCTSVVHLAGALGRPTTLLKSATPEWRWGLAGQRSVWYDSVTVLRQAVVHQWLPVIAALARGLQ